MKKNSFKIICVFLILFSLFGCINKKLYLLEEKNGKFYCTNKKSRKILSQYIQYFEKSNKGKIDVFHVYFIPKNVCVNSENNFLLLSNYFDFIYENNVKKLKINSPYIPFLQIPMRKSKKEYYISLKHKKCYEFNKDSSIINFYYNSLRIRDAERIYQYNKKECIIIYVEVSES